MPRSPLTAAKAARALNIVIVKGGDLVGGSFILQMPISFQLFLRQFFVLRKNCTALSVFVATLKAAFWSQHISIYSSRAMSMSGQDTMLVFPVICSHSTSQ